ncbi:MAG: HNH endonuclease [Telluria sp.]
MENENWLPLVGWEGVYDISDLGRIARIKKHRRCRTGLISCTSKVNGYPIAHLRDGPERHAQTLLHRLVALTFLGPSPAGQSQVNHKNGNRSDPRLVNLEWVSCSENHLHAYRTLGRSKVSKPNKGEAHGRSKLTDANVIAIRERYGAGGISQQSIANEFGVNVTTISFVVRRVSWTHI